MKQNYLMKLLLLLFLSYAAVQSQAQTWFPIGAKWYYGFSQNMGIDEGYYTFEVVGDSVIQSKNCKVVHQYSRFIDHGLSYAGYYLFYYENNKVYQLINNQFYVLYDFNAQKGDKWITRLPRVSSSETDSMKTVVVDSISQLIVSNDTLKVMYVTVFDSLRQRSTWQFENPITEKIGGDYMFLWGTLVAGAPYLRCYADNKIAYYKHTNIPCDTVFRIKYNDVPAIVSKVKVFPVPTKDFIHIELGTSNTKSFELNVYDLNGKNVLSRRIHAANLPIDIRSLSKGIYCMQIRLDNSRVKIIKTIIKQ